MKRVLAAAIAIIAGSSCATGTTGERTASATSTMAIGGGFVAVGTVGAVGAGLAAGVITTLPAPVNKNDLYVGVAITAAIAVTELIVGGLLLKNGGEQLAAIVDGAGEKATAAPRRSRREDIEAAEEMQERVRERREAQECTPGWDCPVEEDEPQ